ncbi:MAG: UDP-3-O-(3-hydroxymyristoyl)glucosamine N-acyltransferase [Pseudomonadota bacterium]
MSYRLGQLADQLGLELDGDPQREITHIATLANAGPEAITFLADSRYRKYLAECRAGAVILTASEREHCPVNALISSNPYLSYARLTALFAPQPEAAQLIHETAVIHEHASIGRGVRIGANAVVGRGSVLGDDVTLGPGTVVGEGSIIGNHSQLHANVTVYHDCQIGQRVVIHAGAVIGSDGFGFAKDNGEWIKIHQLGRVILGNDVEVGANTSIDRGALDDTVIGDGVKLDNQIQIAHNVRIGANTAMAGCVGIAGSAEIGENCAIGGGVGILGHLRIADGVTVTAMSLVPNSIKSPGVYSGGTPLEPKGDWQKNYVRFKQLDDMARRIKKLERALNAKTEES